MISHDIAAAAAALRNEEVIGLPTETVYGLAGNIYSEKAVHRIFNLKSRPLYNPLIVHIKGIDDLQYVTATVPEPAIRLAAQCWPGSLTLLLPKHRDIPSLITAGNDRVAVRIPDHPVALELLKEVGFPLAAPSANPFGSISPTTATHVYEYFGEAIPFILEGGPCKKGLESTIIGFENDTTVVYRLGALTLEFIESIAGTVSLQTAIKNTPVAPGMLGRHYAPATRLVVTDNIPEIVNTYPANKTGVLAFDTLIPDERIGHQVILSATGNLEEASARLYDALHTLDKLGLDLIIAPRFPNHGLGRAINDRLQRAAFQR